MEAASIRSTSFTVGVAMESQGTEAEPFERQHSEAPQCALHQR